MSAADTVKLPNRRRALIACAIGNLFETFDFAVYGFLAVPIAANFFPGEDGTASLLKSFATFAVGFLLRPVGAIVIGSYSDRRGRVPALVLCFTLMSLATGLTCILPGYAVLGEAAPALLVLLRMVQGFSVGGGGGAVTSFFIEYSPEGRRGLMGGLQTLSIQLGAILGSLVAAVVAAALSPGDFLAWGWRIPFALGIIPAFVAAYLRFRVPEPPVFVRSVVTRELDLSPIRQLLRHHRRTLMAGAAICMVGVVANFAFVVFLASLSISKMEISPTAALLCSTLASIITAVGAPFAGRLSDHIGRKPMIVATSAGFLVLAYPLYLLATSTKGSIFNLAVAQTVEAILHCGYVAVLPTLLAELFPTGVRSTAISISYGVVVAIFGGLCPLVSLWLIGLTGNIAVPGIMVTIAAAISLFAILKTTDRTNLTFD